MKKNLLVIIFFTLLVFSSQAQDSTLNKECLRPGMVCGECESNLQEDFDTALAQILSGYSNNASHWGDNICPEKTSIRSGITMENALELLTDVMRKHNPKGKGKLNTIIVGQSASIQSTRPGFPRVLFKSPEGELWITINTDPDSERFNTIEIMRWNGKKGAWKGTINLSHEWPIKLAHRDFSF